MQVTFKYELNQKVCTPVGKYGVVGFIGFGDYGNHYWVKTGVVSDWYYEEDLKPNPGIWLRIKSAFSV